MENQTELKNFNAKLWICVIGVILSIAIVAVVCLGIALFRSNETLEELRAESEDGGLQSGLGAADDALEKLTAEYALVSEALSQAVAEQKGIEERVAALEKISQAAKEEIDRLKTEAGKLKEEIAALKELQAESEDKIRIYIDQGHNPVSYHNSGATGNGLYEQDITFLIGCVLADLLKTDGRFEVQLSRPNKSVVLGTDNKSSLMARVEGAAKFEADYLISLHTNSFTQSTATGAEVHVAKEGSESYVFGETLLKGMVGSTKLRDRGVKLNPDLDILEFSAMPAVLLEMGFISNSSDAALLSEHPELFAQGIYDGILDYFGLLPNN